MLRMPSMPSPMLQRLKPPPPFPLPPQWWKPPPPNPLPPHPPSVLPPKLWKPVPQIESHCRQVTVSEPSFTLLRRAYPTTVLSSVGSMPHPSALRLKGVSRICRAQVKKSSRGFATASHRATAWSAATRRLSTSSATPHSLPLPPSNHAVLAGCNNLAATTGDEVIPPKFYYS